MKTIRNLQKFYVVDGIEKKSLNHTISSYPISIFRIPQLNIEEKIKKDV